MCNGNSLPVALISRWYIIIIIIATLIAATLWLEALIILLENFVAKWLLCSVEADMWLQFQILDGAFKIAVA